MREIVPAPPTLRPNTQLSGRHLRVDDGNRLQGEREGATHAESPGVIRALIVIASVLLGLAALFIAFFMITVPTTFGCRGFIDASAEARLEYPNGRVLSYSSHEGSRDLTGMSNPQSPGFTKYWEISLDDREAFGWFDQQLRASGWKPLESSTSAMFRQAGFTERGSMVVDGSPRPAEVISLISVSGDQIAQAGVPDRVSAGKAVLRFIYLVATPAAFPACR